MTNASRAFSPRLALALLAVVFTSSLFGCAEGEFRFGDPFDRKVTLSEAQHRYTVLVRWNNFKKARQFVNAEDRDAFMQQTKSLEEARFTDYDSEPIELDAKKEMATIKVTYTLWTPFIPYEIEITEIQEWTREGITNDWQVSPYFEDLNKLAAN